MAGGAIAAAAMQGDARREIVRHFTEAEATAPQRAVAYDPDAGGSRHRRLRRRTFERMRGAGVLKEPRPGLFYLDEDELDAFRWRMRQRALGVVAVLGAVAAVAIALG